MADVTIGQLAMESGVGVETIRFYAVGDDVLSLMPHFVLDMLVGRNWEMEHPDLAAAVREHITTMERQSGRRPTFAVKRKTTPGSRRTGMTRGR